MFDMVINMPMVSQRREKRECLMQKCHYLTTNQAYEVSLLFSEKKKEINVLESPYIVTDKYSKTVSFV